MNECPYWRSRSFATIMGAFYETKTYWDSDDMFLYREYVGPYLVKIGHLYPGG